MSSIVYLNATTLGRDGGLAWDATESAFRVLLAGIQYVPNPNQTFVNEVTHELSGTGYERLALSSRTVQIDNSAARSDYSAASVLWSGINAGTAVWAVIYKSVNDDSDSLLIAAIDLRSQTFPNGFPTSGGPLELNWNGTTPTGTVFHVFGTVDAANATTYLGPLDVQLPQRAQTKGAGIIYRDDGSSIVADVGHVIPQTNGAKGDGSTNDRTAIANADTAAVAAGKHLYFPPGVYRVGSDLTITSPCEFSPAANIKPDSGVAVTHNGAVANHDTAQCWDISAGGSVVLGTNSVPQVTPQNFGAKCDGSDDHDAILAAIKAAFQSGALVVLPPGTYSTSPIAWPSGAWGVRMRGAGMHASTIKALSHGDIFTVTNRSISTAVFEDFGLDGGNPINGNNPRTFSANASTDTLTVTSHGYSNGQLVILSVVSSGVLPAGLFVGHGYFVMNETTDTFQVSLSPRVSAQTFTADASTDTITCTGHGYSNGQLVKVSNTGGALPAGLSAGVSYFVIGAATSANTFKLSTSLNGAAIDLTTNGTGTQSVVVVPVDITDTGTGTFQVGTILGTGCGFNINIAGAEAIGFAMTGLYLANFGNAGISSPNNSTFSSRFIDVEVDHCYGHGLDLAGGSAFPFVNCYWHTIPVKDKFGIHCSSAQPIFQGCNGQDGGAGGWGLFGADDAHEGLVLASAPIFSSCNFEDFTENTPALKFRVGSFPKFDGASTFIVYQNHVGVAAVEIDFASGGSMDHGSTFVLSSGSTWANGTPIHVTLGAGTPPIIHGKILDQDSNPVLTYHNDGEPATYNLPSIAPVQSHSVWHAQVPGLSINGPSYQLLRDNGTTGTSFGFFGLYTNKQQITLSRADVPCAITGGAVSDGATVILHIVQGTGGNMSVSWDTNFKFGTLDPTLSTVAGKRDIFTFEIVGGQFLCTGIVKGL